MKKLLSVCCLVITLVLCLGILVACGDKNEMTESAVTSVTVNKKGTQITIKATLTEADLDSFKSSDIYNQKLYLMALEPGDTVDSLAGKTPLAECGMSTSPKFKVDTYASDNFRAHSRLHCAYAIAVFNKTLNSYVLLTAPVYVSNTADLAENTANFPTSASIKGLHTDISSDASYLGVAHTVIELDPSLLIQDDYTNSAVSYVYDGQTYYLNRGKLEELDKQVSEATAQGSIVYFRLRMRTSPDNANSLVSCLYADGITKKANSYAIWMDDDKSASLMAGFLDFITARYTDPAGTHGFCGALIIGRSVNESTKNNYAGSVEFGTYVSRYAALVRLANSTLKSNYANGRVYVCVSNNLSDIAALESGTDWTTNYFLDQFNLEVMKGGNYDWNVAISAYHYNKNDPLWSDAHANPQQLSPAHISDFMWISQADHYYDGERRHTIISDFEVAPMDDQNLQAASYAYAYYKVLENGNIDALIYSAHTDSQSLIKGSGLWITDSKGIVTDRRVLYNIFLTIDTKDTSVLDSLSMPLGWSSIYDAQANKAATRQFVSGSDTTEAPSGKSNVIFSFTNSSFENFIGDESVAYLELSKTNSPGGYPVLAAHLDRTQPGAYMGISNTTLQGSDLKGIKTCALTMCAAADTQTPVSIKLRLYKEGKSTLSGGDADVVYEEIVELAPNEWKTVYFDVSEFTSLVGGDDPITVSVQVKVPELDKDGSCTLLLDRVAVYGKLGVQGYEWLIIIISIVVLLVLSVGLIYLLYRKYGAPPVIANIFWNVSNGKIKLHRYQKSEE